MTLDEFFAEAKRLNLTAADLVPGLTMRPEFDDCLSKDFREAKAAIMAMPEAELRELAIAQLIQLRFHEKYGNAMANANAAYRAEQRADAGVASVAPMQGLADFLRSQAQQEISNCDRSGVDERVQKSVDCLRQWAREVDAAPGVALPQKDQP